jgi:signal-transduction protein with cAMP-binding, CBS, and nucleotidyltransferase domain
MSRNNRLEPNRAELEAEIAAHPFFIGMNAHYIRLLPDCAMTTRFEKDQVIFRAGDTANRFYLIESGKVVLESRPGMLAHGLQDDIGGGVAFFS